MLATGETAMLGDDMSDFRYLYPRVVGNSGLATNTTWTKTYEPFVKKAAQSGKASDVKAAVIYLKQFGAKVGIAVPPPDIGGGGGKFGLTDQMIIGVPNWLLYAGGGLIAALGVAKLRKGKKGK